MDRKFCENDIYLKRASKISGTYQRTKIKRVCFLEQFCPNLKALAKLSLLNLSSSLVLLFFTLLTSDSLEWLFILIVF